MVGEKSPPTPQMYSFFFSGLLPFHLWEEVRSPRYCSLNVCMRRKGEGRTKQVVACFVGKLWRVERKWHRTVWVWSLPSSITLTKKTSYLEFLNSCAALSLLHSQSLLLIVCNQPYIHLN